MRRKIVASLTATHRNMEHVLALLRLQIDMLSPDSQSESFTFLNGAIHYLSGFPGLFHHPAEELIFECLVDYVPQTQSTCFRLREEHELFTANESMILAHITQARAGDPDSRHALQALGRTYCDVHVRHIDLEENEVLPAALVWLQEEDWSRVDHVISRSHDPLTAADTLQQYETVYDYLMSAETYIRLH